MKIGNKYIGIINGREWDKEQLNLFKFSPNSLGWFLQLWRLGIYYDNWNKIDKNIKIKR